MHVESIDFKQKGPRWLDIVVTVNDDISDPVKDAMIVMEITYPDGSVPSTAVVTNSEGAAKHQISRPAIGIYTVTIADITHDTLVYDPNINKETTDRYTVT